ncbi:MAG: hypothetical protein MJZ28_07895 [Paludibacteraceae bacterium]|nr:hypothetical protein [Paludibacteraceae bacterium]
MAYLNGIWDFLKNVARSFWSSIKKIARIIISFYKEVVGHFQKLVNSGKLQQGRDTPFIAKNETLKRMIHEAPNFNAGIFEATYNENTEEVENIVVVEGQLDAQTEDALSRSKNGIVTLS